MISPTELSRLERNPYPGHFLNMHEKVEIVRNSYGQGAPSYQLRFAGEWRTILDATMRPLPPKSPVRSSVKGRFLLTSSPSTNVGLTARVTRSNSQHCPSMWTYSRIPSCTSKALLAFQLPAATPAMPAQHRNPYRMFHQVPSGRHRCDAVARSGMAVA